MEVLDLSNPNVLRQLMTSQTDGMSSFISELMTNDDSDVELDPNDGELQVLDQSNALPIHRRRPDEEEEEATVEDMPRREEEEEGWRQGAAMPTAIPFTGDSGLQVPLPEDATPLDCLHLMINQEMMESNVTETNRYAAESLRGKQLSLSSRFKKWVDVTTDEMWAFFGLIIAMGLIIIEDLDDYWSMDEVYNLPLFRSVIKRNRFCIILSFLHLCNNNLQLPRTHPDDDPLYKIRRCVTQLNDNFKRVFKPSPNIAIDEAMVAWRGHLSFRCYNPDKLDKFDIKVFALCDSATGYCSNLEFYICKRETSSMGATFDVVHRHIEPYLGSGSTLYVDTTIQATTFFPFLKQNNTGVRNTSAE